MNLFIDGLAVLYMIINGVIGYRRGIVEELMLELMYDLPSKKNIKNFTITRAMVDAHTGAKVLPLPIIPVSPISIM